MPSLTETVAYDAPDLLVGATDWCSRPATLAVTRVRGTKNPNIEAIIGLRPDVVLANAEENREPDLDALRAAGIAVYVTAPTTVPGALASLSRLTGAVCGLAEPDWLRLARETWAAPYRGPRRRALVPIWRRPWMAIGRDTFAGDVLRRLGVDNVLAGHRERYPRIDPADPAPTGERATGTAGTVGTVGTYDLVVLPDEPYAFDPSDGPEAFPGVPAACVSGRHLTWYGPSLASARAVLGAQLASTRRNATADASCPGGV